MEYSAEMLFSMIGDREHAVKRSKDPKEQSQDRRLRDMIHEENLHNHGLIINNYDGNGYWNADMNDPEQVMACRVYLKRRKSHIKREAAVIRAMETTMAMHGQMSFDEVGFDDL